MNEQLQIIEAVRERDIDLLILEELYAQTGFDKLFLKLINKSGYKFSLARHSVVSLGLGETDVWIEFTKNKKSLFILLENKIDADFQPNQYERYEQKVDFLRKEGHEAFSLLIAPKKYLNSSSKFDHRISYEEIYKWFSKFKDNRSKYKLEVINLAIKKPENSEPDEIVTNLWSQYYLYLKNNLPELKMKDPGGKPSNSSFSYFKAHWLPPKTKLVHKMNKGYLDLQISGEAKSHQKFYDTYSKILKKDIGIVVVNKSLAFRIELPPISLQKTLDEQLDTMNEFCKKYHILKNWIIDNYRKQEK